MTKIEALTALLAKVEAGDLHTQEYGGMPIVTAMYQHFGGFAAGIWNDARFMSAYHGSLDAAMALHEAVLPGWGWKVGSCSVSDDACVAPDFNCPNRGKELLRTLPAEIGGMEWPEITDVDQRPPGNPARAWLIAILEALIATEKNDDN